MFLKILPNFGPFVLQDVLRNSYHKYMAYFEEQTEFWGNMNENKTKI